MSENLTARLHEIHRRMANGTADHVFLMWWPFMSDEAKALYEMNRQMQEDNWENECQKDIEKQIERTVDKTIADIFKEWK